MPTCCIENICRVICDATFEPVVVCDDWRPLACNQRLIEVFKYKKEAEIVCQPIQDFMRKHFTPKEVFEKGQNRQVKIADLTYAMVSNSDMSEKMAIVKTKEWHFENRTYYTISIRDVPILKFAQKEWMPIETENNPMRNMVSDINEPQLESRLLSEFALLADAIPVMVWICGREGEIYYANRRVKETWGIDVLSEPWDQNIHPEDWEQFVPLWQDASKSLTPFKMEARYRNKQTPIIAGDETGWRWHIFQSIPVFRNGELKRWVLTAVDVHDWKRAEAEKQMLKASEQMATEASRLKSAFLSMMSHEIRTPLFGIVGNTSLLKETDITSDQRSFIDTIDGSARLMMSVIQDILDFSQIEAGKLNLNKVSFSLGHMLGQVSRIVEDSALRKSLGYSISIPNEDYILEGDLHRFQQIIINLSSNALKFTHNGKVSIDVKAENLETGQVGLRLTFADTGIGMTEEISKKLFSPWTQADSSNRRLYGGSGLGLAITKSLVDMMGGTIGLSTEKEVGSTFWVELTFPRGNAENSVNESPLSPDSPLKAIKFEFYDLQEASKYISNFNRNKSADHQTTNGNSSKKMHSTIAQTKRVNNDNDVDTRPTKGYKANKNKKPIGDKNGLPKGKRFQVLLAEDNPVNQAILVRFLEKMGCIECELTSDGQQALNAYRSRSLGHYHVILLDQSMPKMDGDEVCREIRKMDPDQVVISVSANALLSDRTHFLEIGMNDHISKPVTFVNFRETVTKWLLKVNNQSKDKEINGKNEKNENENENKNENR